MEHPAKYEHQQYVCKRLHDDDGIRCMFCNGGLYACNICGGAEGSVPTDCPGRMMTAEEQKNVYKGTIDFVGGIWINQQPYFAIYANKAGDTKYFPNKEKALDYFLQLENSPRFERLIKIYMHKDSGEDEVVWSDDDK